MELERVDKIGKELGLTHTINKNVLVSFKKAERLHNYSWYYNLKDELIYKWNRILIKLRIEVK